MHAFSLFLVVASRARAPCQIMLELTTFQKTACPAHSPLLTGCCVVHQSINQCCTTHHGAACSWRSSLTGENLICCMWTFHAEPQGLLAAGFLEATCTPRWDGCQTKKLHVHGLLTCCWLCATLYWCCLQLEKFIDGKWQAVAPSDRLKITQLDGQVCG